MTLDEIAAIVANIKFGDWKFRLSRLPLYLQIEYPSGIDNRTGAPIAWKGRKWMLSRHMTEGEVVQTAWLAVQTAAMHEAREQFLYEGLAVMDPHYDIRRLLALRADPASVGMRADSHDQHTAI